MPSRFDVSPMRTMTKLTLDVETAAVEAAKEQERPAKVLAIQTYLKLKASPTKTLDPD